MSDRIDRLVAEGEVESLLKRLGLASFPICPFAIAEKHDIHVEPKASSEPGVSGYLMRVGNAFGIQYATHVNVAGYVRFTVAHELGHYFLPNHAEALFPAGDGLHRSQAGFFSADKYERQADHFAAALLMPERPFLTAASRAGSGFAAIEQLAGLCDTSLTSTAIRYALLAETPIAVIVSTGSQIDYCFMSEQLGDLKGLRWIRKGDLVPPQSTTGKFVRTESNVSSARREEGCCSLDLWFDGAPDVEVNEDVVGLGAYGKTLTVLFTDELPEEEEDDD